MFGKHKPIEKSLCTSCSLGPRDDAPRPEVRPSPGQRVALFKNAAGVFIAVWRQGKSG